MQLPFESDEVKIGREAAFFGSFFISASAVFKLPQSLFHLGDPGRRLNALNSRSHSARELLQFFEVNLLDASLISDGVSCMALARFRLIFRLNTCGTA